MDPDLLTIATKALIRIADALEASNQLHQDFADYIRARDARDEGRARRVEVRALCRPDQVDAVRAAMKELGLE